MSIAGILSSNLFNYQKQSAQNQSQLQQFQQEFQQLGQDLQSGNLTAAQSDVTTLQQLGPKGLSEPVSANSTAFASSFHQLSQDLQSGNTSAAEQDYATLQQQIQNHVSQMHHHHHHSSVENSQVNQLFQQLGQDLQSGNLTAAQQAYATLQQDLPQIGSSTTGTQSSSSNTPVSVSA